MHTQRVSSLAKTHCAAHEENTRIQRDMWLDPTGNEHPCVHLAGMRMLCTPQKLCTTDATCASPTKAPMRAIRIIKGSDMDSWEGWSTRNLFNCTVQNMYRICTVRLSRAMLKSIGLRYRLRQTSALGFTGRLMQCFQIGVGGFVKEHRMATI